MNDEPCQCRKEPRIGLSVPGMTSAEVVEMVKNLRPVPNGLQIGDV